MREEAGKDLHLQTLMLEFERAFPSEEAARNVPRLSFSGYESNVLFHNRGDGRFEEIGVASGAGRREDGRGVAVADFDRDGRLDLIMSNSFMRPLVVLQNQGTGTGAWLSVKLRGVKSNRLGVGARVTLSAADQSWTREVEAGNGFLSSHPADLHFGLGDVETVSMSIRWPSGEKQTFPTVKTRAFVTATEGEAELQRQEPRASKPLNPSPPPRPVRAGDQMPEARLTGPDGLTVTLPPKQGWVALVIFSGGCMQCRDELVGADDLDDQATSMTDTKVVWASLDGDQKKVEGALTFLKLQRRFVMLDETTKEALLGPGKPHLPVTLALHGRGIAAKFIGADSAVRALKWIADQN